MNTDYIKNHVRDKFKNMKKNADSWRVVAFILLAANLILAAGFVFISKQRKIIPYIVQVDQHGYEIAVKPLEDTSAMDSRIIISRIGRFIISLRSVIRDEAAQISNIQWVYSSIPDNSPALMKTRNYFKQANIRDVAFNQNITCTVEIKNILPISKDTWRAEWVEKKYKSGTPFVEEYWTGLFTIGITPSNDMKNIIQNPLGIYITDYSASQNIQ